MTEQQLREEIAKIFREWCMSSSYYWGLQERLVKLALEFTGESSKTPVEGKTGHLDDFLKLKN